MPLMRGMKHYRPGSIQLRFGDYLNKSALPPLPKTFGHDRQNIDWGMLGNDQAGNCVIAGAMHRIMMYAVATGRPVPRFTPDNALANYSNCLVAAGQPPFNPHDPSTDTGLDPQQAASWERKHGIVDADGTLHKISAYAIIDNPNLLMAAYLCGGVGLCLSLPATAEKQFAADHIWDDVKSKGQFNDGHYLPFFDVNSKGQLVGVTWGANQAMIPAYQRRYTQVAIAYISQEYMEANGVSPEAIKWDDLNNYLSQLGQVGV